jgi:hypothetical protein
MQDTNTGMMMAEATTNKDVLICDLDGTLTDTAHRAHMITGDNPDWDGFFLASEADPPKPDIIQLVTSMALQGYYIHLFSGRGAIAKDVTLAWLRRHDVPFNALTMRPIGDHTPDEQLKQSWCELFHYTPQNVLCVLDDRAKVVNMWRERGFTCLQVAPGDF